MKRNLKRSKNQNQNGNQNHRTRPERMNKRRARYQSSPLCDEDVTTAMGERMTWFIANTGVNA